MLMTMYRVSGHVASNMSHVKGLGTSCLSKHSWRFMCSSSLVSGYNLLVTLRISEIFQILRSHAKNDVD
jgi:hypothetical protein